VLAAYEGVRSSLDQGPCAAPVRPGSRVPYVPTAALLVRREALIAIGGFDTDMTVGEDVDLVWRLRADGWRVRYDPSVVVSHPSRATVSAWVRQRIAYGESAAALARRHGADAAAARISAPTVAAWTAFAAGHPGVAAGVAVGSGAVLGRRLERSGLPRRAAARVGAAATWWASRQVADAVRRPWWPVALVTAATVRRARPAVLAAFVVPAAVDAFRLRRRVGIAELALLGLADDVAYGLGVWIGCVRQRSARALLPERLSR
jgi:mycofactocin system glycosyltransferase